MITVSGRVLYIPPEDSMIAFTGDNKVESRQFRLEKYYNEIDLSLFDFKLDTSVKGTENIIDLSKQVVGNTIFLTWTVEESHVSVSGQMAIQIRAFLGDTLKWHSTQEFVVVKESINASAVIPDSLPSEFEQMEVRITLAKNEAQEAEQVALGQANRAQGIADTFENTTLPAAIQSVEQAVEEQIGIAKGHADRAQGIADTFSNTTLPEGIIAIQAAGQAKVDDAAAQATIATNKAEEAFNSAAAAFASEQAAKGSEDWAREYAEDAGEFAGDAEESAQIAANNILNGVDTHNQAETAHADIRDDIRTVEAIARGKAQARVFETYTAMVEWLAVPENVALLSIGDNLYIKDVNVYDYWWDGVKHSPLEAEAPDLTNYYTKAQVDGMMPITITRADYDALVAAGTVEAGRIYFIVEGDLA